MDLDTFFTTLYVLIDDWYKREMQEQMTRKLGSKPQMSDSEVLTVAIAAQWRVGVPWQSERGIVRYILKYGLDWFPQMLQRSQFNLRVRQLWAVFVRLQQLLADWLQGEDDLYECVDCTNLPHCSLSQAASSSRHWLSGKLGRGGNHGGWFYGEQLLLTVLRSGIITGWVVGLAQIDDRWMMEALLSTRQCHMQLRGPELRPKQRHQTQFVASPESFSPAITVGIDRQLPYLVDQGFNGQRWIEHWQEEYQSEVIAVPPANSKDANSKGGWDEVDKKWLASHRQIVETVFSRLSEVFGIKRLNAHSDWGKITRIAAKTAAYNFGILFNRILGRPDGALATLLH